MREKVSPPPTTPLAKIIAEQCLREGSHPTAIAGLYLTRSSTAQVPRQALDQAVFCVVAQGSKSILLNGQRFVYDSSKYLLVSLELPLVGQIEEASRAKPFLGWSLVLDFNEIRDLMQEADLPREARLQAQSGIMVGTLREELLSAVTRLTQALREPAQLPILSPLIRREIFYRLLLSEQSGLLYRMIAENAKAKRIAAGLDWLRRNATRAIRMEDLARELHMSPSSMHGWFRSVTSMSPLQFQKQLRLQEARRIMLSESVDANAAARRVGYQSASQFSREYGRFFGAPPMRDVENLRLTTGGRTSAITRIPA